MRQALQFLAILILAGVAAWYSLSPRHPVAKGLDLQGGMRVTLEPNEKARNFDPTQVNQENMERVRSVIENRVNSFGLSGTDVRLKGNRQILVLLPGVKNPEEALKGLTTVAQLEFRHLNQVQSSQNPGARYRMNKHDGDPVKGEPDSYTFTDTQGGNKEISQEDVLKESELIVTGKYLKPVSQAQINPQNGQPIVTFEFNSEGARAFGDFTTKNVGEILAVVLDDRIITAPNIREPITEGHGEISGGFKTMAEGRILANLLNSGALPIPLKPAETQVVGATLGQESVNKSIHAGLIGLGLVLLFMLAYYALPGVLACIALLIYAAITFTIFKGAGIFQPIVLDLPGITGFILSVGMAVDANILIFERLKEEMRAGKSLHAAVDAGFSRAFTAILDSNVTTWIVCAILVWLGAPIVKGFAITLAIGVAVSMFTAITVTRTMLHLVLEMPWARNPALYGLNTSWLSMFFPAWKQGAHLQVFNKRHLYLGFSVATAILSLLFVALTPFGKGLQPGIDFTGGSVVEAAFRNKDVTREQVVAALPAEIRNDATISIGRSERDWTVVTVEATDVEKASQAKVRERLANSNILGGFDPGQYEPKDPKEKQGVAGADAGQPRDKATEANRAGKGDTPAPGTADRGATDTKSDAPKTEVKGETAVRLAQAPKAQVPSASGATADKNSNPAKGDLKADTAAKVEGGKGSTTGEAPKAAAGTAPPAGTTAAPKADAGKSTPAAGTATAAPKGDVFRAKAVYIGPVTEADVRRALNTKTGPDDVESLGLKNLKVTVTPENHKGGDAVPVALIQSRHLSPEELRTVKADLQNVGGGIVEPMYQESSIGPSVAREVTLNAFSSVLVASLAIVLYLAFRFAIGGFMNGLKFGTSAVIALIHDVGIVIGVFAIMGALRGWKVDSLFVTACLTVLGFSVHDTIVVYDRIRENLHHRLRGETFADVSDRSITQTFDRSINTSFTVLLVVAALAFFGGESIRLFNIALLIGVAIGTYSSIFVASPLVVLWERAAAARSGQVQPQPAARPTARRPEPATPRPRRETAPVSTRPTAAPSTEAASDADADETPEGTERTRPGTVRPRKKRRM